MFWVSVYMHTRDASLANPPLACGLFCPPLIWVKFAVFGLRHQLDANVPLLQNMQTPSRSEASLDKFT